MKTKSIAVINQKGGSGKSTLTMLISLALASDKSRVLVIDCDPQGGLSSFLVDPADNKPGLFDYLGKFKLQPSYMNNEEAAKFMAVFEAGYLKSIAPEIRVIGVEPVEADAMYQSLEAGRRVRLRDVGIFADGVAVREVGRLTFPIVRECVDEIVRVSNDAICAAIKDVLKSRRAQ